MYLFQIQLTSHCQKNIVVASHDAGDLHLYLLNFWENSPQFFRQWLAACLVDVFVQQLKKMKVLSGCW